MSGRSSQGALPAGCPPLRWPAWAALALLVIVPRLWRFESVGEGTDEGYSVAATRATLSGRFSYSHLNDFLADGSKQVASSQTTEHGAANVKTLIDDPGALTPWSASSLNTALGTNPASILSLNGSA